MSERGSIAHRQVSESPHQNYSTALNILRYRNMAFPTEWPATDVSAQFGSVPAAESIGQGLAINR